MSGFSRFAAIAAALMLVAGGASYGVAQTARSISASDKAIGAKAHPDLLAQFGGLYDGPQAAYVAGVGRRIAVQSGLANSERDFTVTLLDSPVNNAFAIPGGYVYVTRQLVALMNDEAELASVLGHEIGHVAARHASKRQTTSTIGQILSAGLGAVTGNAQIGQLAGYGAQLYTLRFSRRQEYQADDLGIRYLGGAGYDPAAAADMLVSLNAQATLDARLKGQNAGGAPGWASTHPNTADRVARARTRAKPAPGATRVARSRNRDAFLAAIDGMVHDDNPRQGIVDGRSFRHPDLRLSFTAPAGFAIANGATAVSVTGSGGQAQFADAAMPAGGLAAYVDQAFRSLSSGTVNFGELRRTTVNGIDAAWASMRATASGRQVDVTIFAYQPGGARGWHFLLITPAGQGIGAFEPMVRSFARLSESEAAAIRARRLRIVTARAGDTPATLAERMAYADNRLERFLTLNRLAANATLRAGDKVKIVAY